MSRSSFWEFLKVIFSVLLYLISMAESNERLHINRTIAPVATKVNTTNFFFTFEDPEPVYIHLNEALTTKPLKLYAA